MGESYEENFHARRITPAELTSDQGELLLEELKRFEPYLSPVATWSVDLEPRPQEATYKVDAIEVRLLRIESGPEDITTGWSVSWLEDPGTQTAEDPIVKIEHRHRLSVTTGGQVAYSSYGRVDWMVDPETGRAEKVRSPYEREAIKAFRIEEDAGAAVRAFTESLYAEIDNVRELERLTGVDTRGFTTERFNKVMSLLSQIADPAAEKLQ